ncbi:hypothetical protein D3C87_1076050 [compost metagenome]
MVDALADVAFGRAHRDHQRNQVLLARVRHARRRGRGPVLQALHARLRRGLHSRLVEPVAEGLGHAVRLRAEVAQVVIAQAAADDEHVLVAQRRNRAAQCQVLGRVEPAPQRQLHHRHVGVRVHRGHRREHAVVVAALGVDLRRQAGGGDQRLHALREFGRTGRGVAHLVGVGRKAAVVVDHGRARVALHREHGRLPVRRDHEDGGRRAADLARHVGQRGGELVVGGAHLLLHPGPGAAAVRDEVRGQAGKRGGVVGQVDAP